MPACRTVGAQCGQTVGVHCPLSRSQLGPRGPVSGNGRTWPEPNGTVAVGARLRQLVAVSAYKPALLRLCSTCFPMEYSSNGNYLDFSSEGVEPLQNIKMCLALLRWRCAQARPVTVAVGAAQRQTVTVGPRRSTAPLGPTQPLGVDDSEVSGSGGRVGECEAQTFTECPR